MKLQKNMVVLGVLIMGCPLHAADNKNPARNANIKTTRSVSIPPIPVHVGYDVFSNVEELQESVADLVDSLIDASGTFGYADLKGQQASLGSLKKRLIQIESRLKTKEDLANDEEWLEHFAKPEFSATVHGALREIGLILNTMAQGMEGGTRTTVKMPLRVADNVVDQVQEVRESVQDLVASIDKSGQRLSFYNWAQDEKKLAQYKTELERMEVRLERKEAAADPQWTGWFGGDVYKVAVHDSIAELGNIVLSLAASLSGRPQTKDSH